MILAWGLMILVGFSKTYNSHLSSLSATKMCPPSHPFVYLRGQFCCKHDKEKIGKGECDGGVLTPQSPCCLNDEYKKCPHGLCKTFCEYTLFVI